ncbi:MAG TPA: hypothetical protein VMV05_11495 [bacterium]|nr:hypothetical protein [bacterium]
MDGLKGGARMAVGSLPMMDPQEAIRFQLNAFPEVPSWPQMPRRSSREKMNLQGISRIPGLAWPEPEQPIWTLSTDDIPEVLEALKSETHLERAAFKPEEAAGFHAFLGERDSRAFKKAQALKGQCAGPVTLGLTIQDEKGQPLLASKEGMTVLVQYLLSHARWQTRELQNLHPQVLFFLDEPSLGSDFNPSVFGLQWKDVHAWLKEILEPLQGEGVVTGIHCCGKGPWNWVSETPQEIFHFDAYNHISHLLEGAREFKDFLHKGGMVVWGIVPTGLENGRFPDVADLLQKWDNAFEKLAQIGVPRTELIERSFFSTSCGLGNSTDSVTKEAVKCLELFISHWRSIYSTKR